MPQSVVRSLIVILSSAFQKQLFNDASSAAFVAFVMYFLHFSFMYPRNLSVRNASMLFHCSISILQKQLRSPSDQTLQKV